MELVERDTVAAVQDYPLVLIRAVWPQHFADQAPELIGVGLGRPRPLLVLADFVEHQLGEQILPFLCHLLQPIHGILEGVSLG